MRHASGLAEHAPVVASGEGADVRCASQPWCLLCVLNMSGVLAQKPVTGRLGAVNAVCQKCLQVRLHSIQLLGCQRPIMQQVCADRDGQVNGNLRLGDISDTKKVPGCAVICRSVSQQASS